MDHLHDEDLADYVAGTAGPDARARIDAHIDVCAECRQLFVAVVFGTPSAAPTRLERAAGEPAQDAFECGATILGKYRIERVIGEGGMGRVLLVHDDALDRTVAIKVMRDDLAFDATARARFEREAKMIARLSSDHAVRVHDVGSLGPLPFIVMEYVDGIDLRTRVKERGPLAPRDAAKYVRDACRALAEAHRAGIVHRDVKPQNLLLARDGRIKVVDFGIAKPATDAAPLSRTGAVLGTVAFMAPEQIAGRDVDARADVWALGATLFYLVGGRAPFESHDRTATPKALDDRALDAIVRRCLAPDPANRFASAAELGHALDAYLEPRSARPIAKIVLGASLLASAGVGVWVLSHAHAPAPAPQVRPSPIGSASASTVLAASAALPPSSGSVVAPPAPSVAPIHARCECVADTWRLCKPELLETQCECHDASGSVLFSKPQDIEKQKGALRAIAGKPPETADGASCTGFAAVQPPGQTAFIAQAGTGTLHPCSRACTSRAAYSGREREACSGSDEYGRARTGVLRCN